MPKSKKLRRINNTDRYVTIYQKLLLLSIKEDRKTEKDTLGILTYEGLENTFTGEIAMKIDEEDEDVKTAIEYLLKYKMMEKLSENQYYMTEIVLVTGKEDENIAKNKSIRQSEKTPLTNGQRQKRYKAKKACKEKQYVNMISDKENRDFYNGCYYLAIKKDKYRCKICGAMKDLRAVVLDENNREITYPGDKIVTESNMITMCPTCYHNVILSNESNYTPVISSVLTESNENIEIEKE
jgi:N-terminal phage replisome organiser (Phage_rep_org_N).